MISTNLCLFYCGVMQVYSMSNVVVVVLYSFTESLHGHHRGGTPKGEFCLAILIVFLPEGMHDIVSVRCHYSEGCLLL